MAASLRLPLVASVSRAAESDRARVEELVLEKLLLQRRTRNDAKGQRHVSAEVYRPG
jgi:hypothetical protein